MGEDYKKWYEEQRKRHEEYRKKLDRQIKVGRFLTIFFFAIGILFLILDLLGIVHEAGIIIGAIGLVMGLYFGFTTSNKDDVRTLDEGHKRLIEGQDEMRDSMEKGFEKMTDRMEKGFESMTDRMEKMTDRMEKGFESMTDRMEKMTDRMEKGFESIKL